MKAAVPLLPASAPAPAPAPALALAFVSSTTKPHAKTQSRTRKQAWLALHFTDWSLHAALQGVTLEQRLSLANHALVVLDHDRQRRVLACNAAAWAGGIRPGHTLNAALALCAGLKLLSRDAAAESSLLIAMAGWAQRYTPLVSMEAPNELLLEVRGSLRLFGGMHPLLEHMQRSLQERQLSACLALSSTARASLWLSRAMTNRGVTIATPRQLKPMLAALPLPCLHWPIDVQLRLARFGVTRLGELWRLPRADLARRIGLKYLHELDAALGRQVELRQPFKTVMPYTEHVQLDFEITSTLLLEPVLLGCLKRLQRYLREHDLAMSRLHVELLHHGQQATSFYISLATPSSDVVRVVVLLHEQLARLALPAPVREIKLHVKRLLAAQGTAQDLFSITRLKPPALAGEL